MEPLNVARERQARSKENNPKPSAKKWARIYESLVSLRLDKSAIVDKTAIGACQLSRPLLIKRPLGLAGLDKTAIGFDKTATAAGPLIKPLLVDKAAIGQAAIVDTTAIEAARP